MKEKELEDIKKLDVNEGDTVVFLAGSMTTEQVRMVSTMLKCNAIIVPSFDDIGVLKFNDKK